MTSKSNILVISNNSIQINEIYSKLNLLRDLNQIISSNTAQAMDFGRKFIPDLIIAYVEKNIDEILGICENIKSENVLKNTPIILIFEDFNEDFALSAFDIGINDYLIKPFNESELLMRVIWALQKNEAAQKLEKEQKLLAQLGVVNVATGAYTPEYIARVFTNEIESAVKYKYPITMLAISIDESSPVVIADDFFAEIIRRSIRTADVLGKISDGKFLVILNKANVTSEKPVFERISGNLSSNTTVSIGACESFSGMSFESLSINALQALGEAQKNGGNTFIEYKENLQFVKKESLKNQLKESSSNFKLFKQVFSKKTDEIIKPAFESYKEKMDTENLSSSYEINENYALFEINDIEKFASAKLIITNPEFSKVEFKFIYDLATGQKEELSLHDMQNLDQKLVNSSLLTLCKNL